MFNDFKKFIARGNVLDLAIGVIIGGAFGKIVSSLVNDIVTPVLGILLGKINVSDMKYVINENISINYGMFLQNIIDFLIIAFVVFIFVKYYTKLTKKEEQKKPTEAKLTKDQELLTEIKEILENK